MMQDDEQERYEGTGGMSTPSSLIATGVMTRTRLQAREEARQMDRKRRTSVDRSEADRILELSSKYADPAVIQELQQRPSVDFVVKNMSASAKSSKGEETSPVESVAPPSTIKGKKQSWFSPVRVPLSHRKLVEHPKIFDGITPMRPGGGQPPAPRRPGLEQSPETSTWSVVPRVASVPTATQRVTPTKRRRTVDRQFLDTLRAQNQELYDKLVRRFRSIHQQSPENQSEDRERDKVIRRVRVDCVDKEDMLAGVTKVEDAVLFFMHEKHAHDILYFRRRSGVHGSDQPRVGGRMSLTISSSASTKLDAGSRYMPYDLERVSNSPDPGSGDYYIMSATSLVHHANGSNNDVTGEAIPIAQWVMESKMFSLLLAGIPLFQKFLLRRLFVWWAHETRRLIYDDMRKRVSRSLPRARSSFVLSLMQSGYFLRRVEQIHSLTLPPKQLNAVTLTAVCEHHKQVLSETESRLIDAKEDLLLSMDTMVQAIQHNLDPSTQGDDLYSIEANAIHMSRPEWKSAPLRALRYRKQSLSRQMEAAKLDMTLLEKYIRLMEYMFTESVYLMILGCVQHQTQELMASENHGVICASVSIDGDELVLSPSVGEMKNVLLDGIARLVRLAGNFHFTKNAMSWSQNRGTGSLATLSSLFSSDSIIAQFDLQEVLRQDPQFRGVSAELVEEVANCFDEAAHQMKAFESLKPIYAAVRSVSRTQSSRGVSKILPTHQESIDISRVIGLSAAELGRFLKSVAHRLGVLDRSQHACQKIQSSWKVGFLEIQCRRSITEILELIAQERELLHQHLLQLASDGMSENLTSIQRAMLLFEDRPQLIEYFCEQMKQVKMLKEQEKQLYQDIRNVDEVVRALKRYAPDTMAAHMIQYNLLQGAFGKYGLLCQAYDKFVAKVLPNITQQVNSALQKYTVRCQRFLRIYEEHDAMSTEEELEKNLSGFQEILREIRTIEDATRLYQDYQKMVGIKVIDITLLGDARRKWDHVQNLVTFALDWRVVVKTMENEIFSEQPWRSHLERVSSFLLRLSGIQQNRSAVFAPKLMEKLRSNIQDYQRRLEIVIDMAQPFMKAHHWQQVLSLLDISNYISASGALLSDGSTLTLGFLQSRNLWKFEGHIREITVKAHHDALTESKIDEMKKRWYSTLLPTVRVDEFYEIETTGALRLLSLFEHDLVTVQTLAQITSSTELSSTLAQWAEEISNYQEILDTWIMVQNDWKRLSLIFHHHDVQQSIVDATYEFQSLDRKWKAMMTAAKGSSSLAVCLREVISRAFLNNCSVMSEKLWRELGAYLAEKRHFLPRLYFISDRDLLHIIASTRYPARLCTLISKCFHEIHSLRISQVELGGRPREGGPLQTTRTAIDPRTSSEITENTAVQLYDIESVIGSNREEELWIKALRMSSSPEIWLKDLWVRMCDSIKEVLSSTMDGPLLALYGSNFHELQKQLNTTPSSPTIVTSNWLQSRHWTRMPLQVIALCINVMLTNELSSLVAAERNGFEWTSFWEAFYAKRSNLVSFVRHPDTVGRSRFVASNLIVLFLNQEHSIRELQSEQPSPTSSHLGHHDTAAMASANYAEGSSFSWTKLMRFYYDPFDKRCVIHQCVKSYEYGNAFLGGYTAPILSPLCDRAILAMNMALSLEIGGILHSTPSQTSGKRAMLRELSSAVGCECIQFDCSGDVTYSQFHRLLLGAIQSESCWLSLFGLACQGDMNVVRMLAYDISRLKDAINANQGTFVLDGGSVDISNPRMAIWVSVALDVNSSAHISLMLELSHSLMPIACTAPNLERLAEVTLTANGMTEAARLSRRLGLLIGGLMSTPVIQLCAPFTYRQMIRVANNATTRHKAHPWTSEEKCVVLALWEELGPIVIQDQRLAVIKTVRSMFPSAEDLHIGALGVLTTRTKDEQDMADKSKTQRMEPVDLVYDSDEEDGQRDLMLLRDRIRSLTDLSHSLVATDQFIRKLLDMYQVVNRRVVTIVVGPSACGKTTSIDLLSTVCVPSAAGLLHHVKGLNRAVDDRVKVYRLFSGAFHFKDIYGHFNEDRSWADGFITRFIKQHWDDSVPQLKVPLSKGGKVEHGGRSRRPSLLTTSTSSLSPTYHSSWLVIDGVNDCGILEPLKDIASSDPLELKRMTIPSGDQLFCENASMRIFCEVSDLSGWYPSMLSRCGVLYFPSDLLSYTVLIKRWMQQSIQSKPKYTALATMMARFSRSALPSLLDVCKRHMKPFMEVAVLHLVNNMTQVLASFLDQMSPEVECPDISEVKIVVAFAAMLSLGLFLHKKGKTEFHEAVVSIFPEILKTDSLFLSRPGTTMFDLSLQFSHEQVTLIPFEAKLHANEHPGSRRFGLSHMAAMRRMSSSSMPFVGGSLLSSVFIPTPQLFACREWTSMLLSARLNVLVFGECAVGKTKLLEDVLEEIQESERIDCKWLQVRRDTTSEQVLHTIESGLPRKMRGLHCPGAGKKALIVVVENINLEMERRLESGATCKPCSEMIRQVCDGKGSFSKASKEFVEFRDVNITCSFTLSPYGYPRLSSRFLRHFHLLRMVDPAQDVFRSILTSYPDQFLQRFSCSHTPGDIARLCHFSIETFNAIRKRLPPTNSSPYLQLSLNDVMRCFNRLMTASVKCTENLQDLELFSVYCTYQVYRSRVVTPSEVNTLQRCCLDVGTRHQFSPISLDVIHHAIDYIFADYNDNEGCSRITARAATALFIAADERFQWYNRGTFTDAPIAPSLIAGMEELSEHATETPEPVTSEPPSGEPVEVPTPEATEDNAAEALSSPNNGPQLEPVRPTPTKGRGQLKSSTAAVPAAVQNVLDIVSIVQSGWRRLLLYGTEPSKRRSATMIASGSQAYHFREVTSQLKLGDFVEQLKGPVMNAGLKAAHTLMFVECDSLSTEELEILMHVMQKNDLPQSWYSSVDKARILAQEHHLRSFQHTQARRPSVSSFFDDLTAVTSVRDGVPVQEFSGKEPRSPRSPTSASPPSPRRKSIYHENLGRCLYVAIAFGSATKLFDVISNYPNLYYQAVVKTFHLFDRASLGAVYNECLGGVAVLHETLARATVTKDTRHDLRGLGIAIHLDAMAHIHSKREHQRLPEQIGREYGAARSRIEEFLLVFKTLYLNQRKHLAEVEESLEFALRELEQNAQDARDQLTRSADGQRSLQEAIKSVAEGIVELRDHEQMERDARQSFLLDEQRCSALQSTIEQERDRIHSELAKTLPDVAKATEALSHINKYHITEMKSFVNPPQLVRLVMQAVCVLLGVPPTWTEALRILADIHFLDRLRNFEKDRVDTSLIERVKMFVNHPDFSIENMKRASIASTTLCKWVLTIVHYFEVMRRVAPMQKRLGENETQFQRIDEMVHTERQKLINLEIKLNELRARHIRNLQHEQECQRLHDSQSQWKTEVLQFAKVVDDWIKIMEKRLNDLKQHQFKLIGDCVIVAATASYASQIPHDERLHAIERWRVLARSHLNGRPSRHGEALDSVSMPHPHSFLKYWCLSGRLLQSRIRKTISSGLALYLDIPLAMELVLMDLMDKVCAKIPLLLDPLRHVTRWLKNEDGPNGQAIPPLANSSDSPDQNSLPDPVQFTSCVFVVDAAEPNCVALLEKRINHPNALMILIENVSDCDEATFHALIDFVPLAKKKGNHEVVLATTTLETMLHWKPKVWGKINVIDCSPTRDDLENELLVSVISAYDTAVNAEFEAAKRDYVAEKMKERDIIQVLIKYLHAARESREEVPRSKTLDAHDSIALLQEHEMGRITRFLDEYGGIRTKRQAAKVRMETARSQQLQYRAIAVSGYAFVATEELIHRRMPALAWSTAQVVTKLIDCYHKESSFAGDRLDKTTGRPLLSTQAVIRATTRLFMTVRMQALPSSYHLIYRFTTASSVAAIQGDVDSELVDRAISSDLLIKLVRRRQRVFKTEATDPEPDATGTHVERFASVVVTNVIEAGLSRILGFDPMTHQNLSVPAELAHVHKVICSSFLSMIRDPARSGRLRKSLQSDMSVQKASWLRFIHEANREEIGFDSDTVKNQLLPSWVADLSVFERFVFCVLVFRSVSYQMLDAVVIHYIGEQQLTPVSKRLNELEHIGLGSSSIGVLYDPKHQGVAPHSSIRQRARLTGIRDDLISVISMRNQDIPRIRSLRDTIASGGWIVIQDTEVASRVARNVLRLQLQQMHDVSTTKHNDFRIWLLERVNFRQKCLETHSESRLASSHVYMEYPNSLQEYYQDFLKELDASRKQQSSRRIEHSPRRSRVAGSGAPTAMNLNLISSDQLWLYIALWIHHFVSRCHFERPTFHIERNDDVHQVQDQPASLDAVISHYELERSLRVIQLHQRLCAIASTLSDSSVTKTTSSAESTPMIELIGLVYLGRKCHPAYAGQVSNLLLACLSTTQVPPAESSVLSEASLWFTRLASLRDQLLVKTADVSSISELPLLPHSLYQVMMARRCTEVLRGLRISSDRPKEWQLAAQRVAKQLMTQLPPKTCLVSGVQRQEQFRRKSTIIGWRKRRESQGPSEKNAQFVHAGHQTSFATQWKTAMIEHLSQIELPAMEAHLRYIWDLLENISTMKMEHAAITAGSSQAYHELRNVLHTLSERHVPNAWREGTSYTYSTISQCRSDHYPAPKELKHWVKWLERSVMMYQGVQTEWIGHASLWIPALRWPHACFYSIRHSIAKECDLAIRELIFLAHAGCSSSIYRNDAESGRIYATFTISGTYIWNAIWSKDIQALDEHSIPSEEVTSAHSIIEPLPALTIEVIARPPESSSPSHTSLGLFECPLYPTLRNKMALDEPIAFLLIPTVARSDIIAASGAAVLLSDEIDI